MANAPTTTSAPPSQPDDPRYPRPTWLRTIRWLFLHWWLTPLVSIIILILIYFLDRPSLNQYWWLLAFSLIAIIYLLFQAYTWANSDNTNESNKLRQRQLELQRELEQRQRQLELQRERELEQQPPPPGFKLHHTLRGHTARIRQFAWSPDGRLLASASSDHTIRLWDAQSTQLLHTLSGHSNTVYSVAWSPDGHLLASASDDRTIRLWDAHSTQHLHTLSGHSDWVRSVAWSPNGHLLASASGTLLLDDKYALSRATQPSL